jgi:3-methyl-2-oxobutanoate hydroxymethyltransferase
MAWAIDSLKKLQKIIAANGMKLAIENLPRTCLGRDCADMKTLLDAIPDAYACFDSNHSLKDSNIDLVKTMGDRIIATHISDYDFIDERHLFPGEGQNGWQDIAKALEEVGCFSLVVEKIPTALTEKVCNSLHIPVIGIGGGPADGQVLVVHDMLGMNKGFAPKFLRRYADLHTIMTDAIGQYIMDVKEGDFPNEEERY